MCGELIYPVDKCDIIKMFIKQCGQVVFVGGGI